MNGYMYRYAACRRALTSGSDTHSCWAGLLRQTEGKEGASTDWLRKTDHAHTALS